MLTFRQFKDKLNDAIGNPGILDTDLGDYVNLGYLDLTGAVKFEVCTGENEVTTVDDQNYVDVPAETLGIILVKDLDNDILLGKIDKLEYYRRESISGEPTRYAWSGSKILLTPVPDDTYDLLILTNTSPTPLAEDNDESVLPSIWDLAIHFLSIHNALLNRGQAARSAAYLARAISYISSRITEQDLEILPGLEGLQKRLSELQKGEA